jgi:uncharacterized membrane protein YvbJ
MYCRYCGKKLKEDAVICTGCRRPVESSGNPVAATLKKGPPWSFPMMAGLIIATLAVPFVGLIFGIVGLRSETRKVQGAVLLTVAVFFGLFWLAIILGL